VRRINLVISTAVGIGLIVPGLSACSSSSTPSSTTPTTSMPSASASPSPTGASTEALAAYNGMVKTMVSMFNTGEFDTSLSLYTDGAAQQQLVADVALLRRNGYITIGSPSDDPAITSVNTLSHPETVSITDCWDTANWRDVYATNTAAGPVQATDKPATQATATVTDESVGWRVTTFTIGSTPCTSK
jgi:hypothetical protein